MRENDSMAAIVPTFDCIRERVPVYAQHVERTALSGAFSTLEDEEEVWHIVPKRGRIAGDWCPIRCSDTEGIVAPGHVQRREPTCPDCRALVGLENGTEATS